MSRKNPTSSIRIGFNYEELWGMSFCIEWMTSPESYRAIAFQKIPDELESGHFSLDDIVITDNSGSYWLFQVKHRQHPESNTWDWPHLLTPQRNSTTSLVNKWSSSLLRLKKAGNIKVAAFITNGQASQGIQGFLQNHRIDIRRIMTEASDLYKALVDEIGSEGDALEFFDQFEFRFNEKSEDELEESIRKSLFDDLHVTQYGFVNLKDHLHKEFSRSVTVPVDLEQLRGWCEFDQPRELNEAFTIPKDFQWFNESIHKALVEELKNTAGGVRVLTGKPGCGKSTYLSKLNNTLLEDGILCVRHHYHISPGDESPIERLHADRVGEAFKAQLKKNPKLLGALANKNSQEVKLHDFIAEAAKHCLAAQRSLVVIVDGLDHVLRHKAEAELKALLDEICQPQPGLWVILGMQEVAKPYLPPVIFEKCPEKTWIAVPGLERREVDALVQANETQLVLPESVRLETELLMRIYEFTQGNPLHLRYTLRQLRAKCGTGQVSTYDLDGMVHYDTDIENYYSTLWRQLSDISKTMLLAMEAVKEPLKSDQLFEFADYLYNSPSDISVAYEGVVHMLDEKRDGLHFFHASIRLFIRNQTEWKQQKASLQAKICAWLEQSNHDSLKWAILPVIRYELGNPEPLLAIDRPWLLRAVRKRYSPVAIRNQLEVAAEAAFRRDEFGKCLRFRLLATNYHNALLMHQDLVAEIWSISFKLDKPSAISQSPEQLQPKELLALKEVSLDQRNFEQVLPEILDRLEQLEWDESISKKGEIGETLPKVQSAILDVVANYPSHEVSRVLKHLSYFRDSGWAPDLLALYAKTLCERRDSVRLKELVDSDLEAQERQQILEHIAISCLRDEQLGSTDVVLQHAGQFVSPILRLFQALNNPSEAYPIDLPGHNSVPQSVPEFESHKRQNRSEMFYNLYVFGMIHGLLGHEDAIDDWIRQAPHYWSMRIACELLRAGQISGKLLKQKLRIDPAGVLAGLATVEPLSWPVERDEYELQLVLQVAILSLIDLILSLNQFIGQDYLIHHDKLLARLPELYFNSDRLMELLSSSNRAYLTKASYSTFVEQEIQKMARTINELPDRCQRYCGLAEIALIHDDLETAEKCLNAAVNCLLGYGVRNDKFLAELLQSIDFCTKSGSTKSIDWINRVAPAARNIMEFTDGHDVQDIPADLGYTAGTANRTLLYRYYLDASSNEEFFLAEDLFTSILEFLYFQDPIDQALAKTALHDRSYARLKRLSQTQDGARRALAAIQDYYGEIQFPKTDHAGSYEKAKPDPELVRSTQPQALKDTLVGKVDSAGRDGFLSEWIQHWMKHEDRSVQITATQALRSLLPEKGLLWRKSIVLDALAEFEAERNPEAAFKYLCEAQSSDSGWGLYWSNVEDARSRWELLKRIFPKRSLEFLKLSLVGNKSGDQAPFYTFPIPRGIEFLSMFGHLDICEEVTDEAVSMSESLMADLPVAQANVGWLRAESVDTLDVLLSRLTWPGAYVRERAASALGNLLQDRNIQEEVFKRLLQWIGAQRLVSLVNVGLLPILKAAETPSTISSLDLTRVTKAIPHWSPVIEECTAELETLTGKSMKARRHSWPTSRLDFVSEPSKFFLKYSKSVVAPHYTSLSTEIQKNTGCDFRKCWANRATEIMKAMGIRESAGDIMRYYGGQFRPLLTGFSSMISEIYRTAFLECLHAFCRARYLPEPAYRSFAIETMPIDLSFWRIKPSRMPNWWPLLKQYEVRDKSGTAIRGIEFQRPISEILKGFADQLILGIDGCIDPPGIWTEERGASARLELQAFGYRITGSRIPPAEVVAEALFEKGPTRYVPKLPKRPLNFLENWEEKEEHPVGPAEIGDMVLHPLVSRVRPDLMILWQFFRDWRLLSLSTALGKRCSLELSPDSWHFVQGTRQLATAGDWLEGLSERTFPDLVLPFGCYLIAETDFVNDYLSSNGLRLGFVSKTSFHVKKTSYEQAEIVTTFELHGVSSIII